MNNNNSYKKSKNFVHNKEVYNTKLFDRNMLNYSMLSNRNTEPSYFMEDYKHNRNEADKIFNKRFDNLNTDNLSSGRMGYVDFTKKQSDLSFKKNYADYFNE